MRWRRFYLLIILLGTGCASSTPQTDSLFIDPPPVPRRFQITNVPFINQESGQCGPASLAMIMRWSGKMISVEEITRQVYLPSLQGTLQTDMITAARRNGMLAVPIEGMAALLAEIADGHPVIVFENLAFNWFPRWHYALVFGYDLDSQSVGMHSGPEENKVWEMRKFERSWKLGNYWGLVVLRPTELARSASELTHARAAVGLEQNSQPAAAATVYQSMLKRWPRSLPALIGLGNSNYAKKNYRAAVSYLALAVKYHPESKAAHNNLKIAQNAL